MASDQDSVAFFKAAVIALNAKISAQEILLSMLWNDKLDKSPDPAAAISAYEDITTGKLKARGAQMRLEGNFEGAVTVDTMVREMTRFWRERERNFPNSDDATDL